MMFWKFFGKVEPNCRGNTCSSFSCASIHNKSKSTYSGADTRLGRFTVTPSAHKYSYFAPADMTGQTSTVQNSATVPYRRLISLKKSTVLTASHSLTSSCGGKTTAALMSPLPNVAFAYCDSS